MFDRYTEKARRVIFFARHEASQFGSPYIETEHLLLGLLREDKVLLNRFLQRQPAYENIRREIESHTTIRESVSTSVDLPLSNESRRVLAYAVEEAENLGHKHIGTEHLLLGLLREEKSFGATLLFQRGLRLETTRKAVIEPPSPAESALGDYLVGFVDTTGKRVSVVSPSISVVVPRVGEHVSLEGVDYRVRKVTYIYENVSQAASQTVNRLYKIEIAVVVDKGTDPKLWSETT